MSEVIGKNSQSVVIRRVSGALLMSCVLIAAPASFAQRAGAPAEVTDYSHRQVETAASCSKPISPSIPEQEISRRLERQLNREVREYLGAAGVYLACVRAAHWVADAEDAPESQLLGLVDEHNATVKQVDELAAIYEERIGPIRNVLPRARVADSSARSGIGATPGPTWAGTDTARFPTYVEPPPGLTMP